MLFLFTWFCDVFRMVVDCSRQVRRCCWLPYVHGLFLLLGGWLVVVLLGFGTCLKILWFRFRRLRVVAGPRQTGNCFSCVCLISIWRFNDLLFDGLEEATCVISSCAPKARPKFISPSPPTSSLSPPIPLFPPL